MRWSQQKLDEYLISQNLEERNGEIIPDSGKESNLQRKCCKWLKDKGYPYFHDSSRRKNKSGWFDLVCLLPEGRVVFIELKSEKGRLSEEQRQLHRTAKFLKHEVYEVRSYKHFLHIVLNMG